MATQDALCYECIRSSTWVEAPMRLVGIRSADTEANGTALCFDHARYAQFTQAGAYVLTSDRRKREDAYVSGGRARGRA